MSPAAPLLPFFDTHAHLNLLPPELPADAAFLGARERVLEGLVNIGTRIASSRESVDLAARLPNVWATVGIHPFEAATLTPESLGELRDLAASPRVVGIGETGIDRAEVRRRNLIRPEEMPFRRDLPGGGRVYDTGDYVACLDAAL